MRQTTAKGDHSLHKKGIQMGKCYCNTSSHCESRLGLLVIDESADTKLDSWCGISGDRKAKREREKKRVKELLSQDREQ